MEAQQVTLREVAEYAPQATKDAIHAILPDSYVDINNCPDLSVEGTEDKVIRSDLFRKLSRDAKAVAQIIIDAPAEVLNTNDSLSLTRLCDKLKHEFGWTWSRIYKVRTELTNYANDLV